MKARDMCPARLIGVVRRKRAVLMVSTALQATVALVLAVPAVAQPAPNARPTGGQVVAGSASITQSPNVTTITQSSQRAAVNWRSFDVGAQQTVDFAQPNASAATLNRVTGANPSQIAGRINANGQVILVNPDGVVFYKGSQVNAAGLMVSAAGISNKNFMAGHMIFDQPAHPNARVENQGNITVKEAGLAALVAPQVANSGVITAKLGHVVLAGARTATLDLYGDGLLSIDVTGEVKQLPIGPNGKPVTALVTNSGTVLANGGTVQLTARAADGIVQNLIEAGGRIAANSVGGKTGEIALNGVGGSITVSGQLSAVGVAAGTTGGQIGVVADRGVTLTKTARINASGAAGGGTVAIGTTLARARGGPSVKARLTASHVTVARGARIAANAGTTGNGGRVAVLSSETTQMDGAISATGGAQGGDGGFVEVSGQTLGLTGAIDVTAPHGALGTILLDPGTIDIVNSTKADGSFDTSFTGGTLGVGVGGASAGTVTNFEIGQLGSAGNVILQASTLIDVQASVSVSHGLTMQSGGNLIVDSGGLSITAKGSLVLRAGIVFGKSGLTIGNPGSIVLNDSTLTTAALDISAFSGVSQSSAGTIATPLLTSSLGIDGAVNLQGTRNAITAVGSISVTGADFTLVNAGNLSVTGPLVAHNISLTTNSGGTIKINAGAAVTADNALAFTSASDATEAANAVVSAGTVSGSAGGAVSLIGTANTIGTIAGIAAGGSVAVIGDPGTLTLTGTSSGTTLLFENSGAGAVIALDGAVLKATGTTGVAPRISLIADKLTQPAPSTLNATASGAIELAPATPGAAVTVDVTPGSTTDTVGAVLSAISPTTGTLVIGRFTGVDTVGTTTAGSISLANSGIIGTAAGTLDLEASGSVTQTSTSPLLKVGTLQGTAGSYALFDPGNQIATLTGLTATTGNIGLVDGQALAVVGPVSAANGNIFLQEVAGTALTLTGSLTAQNTGTISLATDLLSAAAGAGITANGGTVEIAPVTPGTPVALPNEAIGSPLVIDAAALGAVTAKTLRIGGYHDIALGGIDTITAGSIDINGSVALATVQALRLDANGPVSESGGPLSVGTLAGSTKGTGGSFSLLAAGNKIGVLGNIAVTGGDFDLSNTGSLTIPSSSTVFANNVSIGNAGTVTIDGNVGACETALGNLTIQATGGSPIVVGSSPGKTPLIGAFGNLALLAGGTFTQNGGLINAGRVTISSGNDGVISTPNQAFTQNGGTIFAVSSGFAGPSVALSETGDFIQGAGGVIASNNTNPAEILGISSGGNISLAGEIITPGSIAITASAASSLISSAGTVAAGTAGLNVSSSGNISQTSGVLSSNGQTTLSATGGDISQTAGVVSGLDVSVDSLTESTAVQGFDGGRAITLSIGTVACDCGGGIPIFPTLPALGTVAAGVGHLLIDVTNGGYAFNRPLTAGWIEFHTLGNTTENTGGALNATLLSGTGASANLDASANAVRILGASTAAYLATGSFLLNDTGTLTVGGSVQAGGGQTIALTAPTLVVDARGSAFTAGGTTFATAGSLVAGAAVASGVVTPGEILLQTDNFSILPATPASPLIVAPDGFVAIAPKTAGNTITVQGSSPGPGNLILGTGTASLAGISTLGALLPGTPATDTLVLGSLDAGKTTPQASAIVFNLNGGTIDLAGVAQTVQLDATGAVTEAGVGSLRLAGLAGEASSFALMPAGTSTTNSIATIGNAATRVSGGVTYQTNGAVTAALGNLTDLLATSGDVQVHDNATGGTLTVIGTVSAPNGHIIDLASPTLVIDHLTTTGTGTLNAAGSLTVKSSVTAGTTVTPGQVLLTADALRIEGAPGTPIITAPDGMVAIAPYTAGNILSVDGSVLLPTPGTLSVAIGDLDLISTLGGTIAGSPLGVHTLALGSTDGGATLRAGGISVNTPLDVAPIAETLALFAANSGALGAGLITQGAGDIITVNALTGSAGLLTPDTVLTTAGGTTSVLLPELNAIGAIGILPTDGGFASTFVGQPNLLATGSIVVHNNGDLDIATLVHAGDDPALTFAHPTVGGVPTETADIEAAPAGASAAGTLFVSGTVWAGMDGLLLGQVNLSGGSASTIGGVSVPGAAFASNGGTVTVGAGYSGAYNAGCAISNCMITIGGTVWGNSSAAHTDADLAGLVQLNAASSIDESLGAIGSSLLTGGARGFAGFRGGPNTTASRNWIAQLGPFDTNLGFDLSAGGIAAGPGLLLRDGRVAASGPALTVVGNVTDHGSLVAGTGSSGISLSVAPGADLPSGYGVGDLDINSSVSVDAATGTITLQATGNVYEGPAGVLSGNALVAQAGAIPATELTGNAPGTLPAAAATVSRASIWLLPNVNQVGTLADATATQEFLLVNALPLLVPAAGNVLAGAAPATTPAASVAGTPIVPSANPTANIDVTGADLTVDGVVHAGLDGTRTGNVALAAADVTINGGVFAANGGAATVSAATNIVFGPGGVIGGDTAAGSAAIVTLTAPGGSIDEPGTIRTSLLTGSAGGAAYLDGAGAPTSNRIATLGSFATNDGFRLRDGQALTVIGPVSDPFSVALSVAPAGDAGYGSADLILLGTVSSPSTIVPADLSWPPCPGFCGVVATPGTVTLAATGNVIEGPGGLIVTNNLVVQAGVIPDTEPGGNLPGTLPSAATTVGSGSVTLGNVNEVSGLGAVTTTQNFLLVNGPGLAVSGPILAGAAPGTATPSAGITVTGGDLAIDGVVHAGLDGSRLGNVALTAADVQINAGVLAADGGAVVVSAGTNIAFAPLLGLIGGDTAAGLAGSVTLTASGGNIDEPGTILTNLLTGSAGGHAILDGTGAPTSNRIVTLGSFTTGAGFALRDGHALAVTGPVSDPQSVSLSVASPAGAGYGAADLSIFNTVSSAGTVSLAATGNVTEGSGGLVAAGDLVAQAGVVPGTEPGGNIPGALPSAAMTIGSGSVALGNVNQVGAVSAATATQNFLLVNGPGLTVTGSVLAGAAPGSGTPLAALTVTGGDLAIDGMVHAGLDGTRTGNVALNAADVLISGGVFAADSGAAVISAGTNIAFAPTGVIGGDGAGGLAGLVALTASGGDIDEPGTIRTGLLTGSAAGHAALVGAGAPTSNRIASLGSFTTGGGFALRDGQALAVTGPVSDPLSVSLSVAPPDGAGYGAADLTLLGTISSPGTVSLAATGNVTEGTGGLVVAGDLVAQAGVIPGTDPGGNVAGTLPSATVSSASVTLGNVNQIGAVSAATATQNFLLANGPGLTVMGTVLAGAAAGAGTPVAGLTVTGGDLVVDGGVHAGLDGARTGNVALTAADILINGGVFAADAGIAAVSAATNITFGPAGVIGGDSAGGLAGAVVLSARGGNIDEPGIIRTSLLTGSAGANAVLVGGTPTENRIGTLGQFTAGGNLAIADTGGLTVTGPLEAANVTLTTTGDLSIPGSVITAALALGAGGAIGETGLINAASLSGISGGTSALIGNNTIQALKMFSAGGLTLDDASSLVVNGPVAAGPAAAITDQGTLTIAGALSAGQVSLIALAIAEPGALATPLLTGSAVTNASFTGTNQIGQISNFTAGGTLAVNDGANVLLSGVITAPLITMNDPGEITLDNGATLVTGGNARPPGTNVPLPQPGINNGAYFSDFTQLGSSSVVGIGGGPSILEITATAGHNITFSNSGGLNAPSTWLALNLFGNAQATGLIFVKSLDVNFQQPGAGGSNLFGEIDLLAGVPAAGAGNIRPQQNANYRFNNCAIGSVNCILLPVEGIPAGNPLQDISLGTLMNPDDEDDLLLPVVTDRDY